MKSVLHNQFHRHLNSGSLEVVYSDGEAVTYGKGERATPRIRFCDSGAERAMVIDPDLRFGELFTDGRIQCENGRVFDVLMLLGQLKTREMGSTASRLLVMLRAVTRRIRQFNSPRSARANIAHHYDLDSGLYELFLDPDRQYSCGYFTSDHATLEEAQLAKKRHIASKLRLEPGMRVLDIGSGWGGLGLYLAEVADVKVTGITLSEPQHRTSNERARERGLADRAAFQLRDYRHVEGSFDRIVSVGMFEHVGVGFYRTFFAKCRNLLKEDGAMLLHTIGRLEIRGGANPWIQKYIFPGGYIPSLSEVAEAVEREDLRTTDVEILRDHYARTLRCWRDRFLERRDEVKSMFGDQFCRMWEFYLAASEMAFVHRNLAVIQFQLARRIDALPITREYMREATDRIRQLEARTSV